MAGWGSGGVVRTGQGSDWTAGKQRSLSLSLLASGPLNMCSEAQAKGWFI